jgi:hypothetical protein
MYEFNGQYEILNGLFLKMGVLYRDKEKEGEKQNFTELTFGLNFEY